MIGEDAFHKDSRIEASHIFFTFVKIVSRLLNQKSCDSVTGQELYIVRQPSNITNNYIPTYETI